MQGTTSYILSKKYTEETVVGLGAIKGANCEVEQVEDLGYGTKVTLGWTGTDGTHQTIDFTIDNGVGIADIKIKDEHLIVTLTDGTEIDAGEIGGSGVASGIWIGDSEPPKDKGYVLWISPTEDKPTPPAIVEVAVKEFMTQNPEVVEVAVEEYMKENPPKPTAISNDDIDQLFNF